MIKIILSGCCGRMGKTISKCVDNFPELSIVAGIDVNTDNTLNYPIFRDISKCDIPADVILDFSRPDALSPLSKYACDKDLPLVICTTGYTSEQNKEIKDLSKSIPIFHSANMSIGINVVNNILKKISSLLYKDFDIEVIEKHHNQKVDAPSGTALLFANTIKSSIEEETIFTHGRNGIAKRSPKEIGVHAIRGGNIVGDHEIIFAGQGEVIEIKHSAISRDVFAIGALSACQFIFGKEKGLYSMDDVVNEKMNS